MRDVTEECSEIKQLLAGLPQVTLPQTLSAQSLFARLDAQEVVQEPQTDKQPKAIRFPRGLRPWLSYAAMFALLVLVYYGVGAQDGGLTASPQQKVARNALDSAAPASSAAAADVPQASMAAEAEMFSMTAPIAEEEALTGAVAMESGTDPYGYYRALAAELPVSSDMRSVKKATPESRASKVTEHSNECYTVRVSPSVAGGSRLDIFDPPGKNLLGSVTTQGGAVLGLELGADSISLVELVETERVVYAGDAWLSVDASVAQQSSDTGTVPDCGAVLLSVYDISDLGNITLRGQRMQEGEPVLVTLANRDAKSPILLAATLKQIELPQQGEAALCNVAPMWGGQQLDTVLDSAWLACYPQGGGQYLLLTVLDAQGGMETRAVQGSNLLVQAAGKGEFVVFSDAQDGAEMVESIQLGAVTIELR